MSGHMGQQAAVERETDHRSAGGRLVASDGRTLPLRAVAITADTRGGLARVVLEQRFTNAFSEALRVTYLVPLPADGAVSAYAFRMGDRRIVGEIDRREAARERFETALVEGRTAALVEQDRANLFTQEIGNIPPGAEVVAELVIDQRLTWLDEGAWEWRFPTVVAPRYLGADGRVADAGRAVVDVAENGVGAQASAKLTIRDARPTSAAPPDSAASQERRGDGSAPASTAEGAGLGVVSPSHEIAIATVDSGLEVALAGERVALDRDIVIRWPVAGSSPQMSIETGRPESGRPHADAAYGLLTVVPPAPASGGPPAPRDLVMLIDTSGSMQGEPLAQAKRVARALVESLTDADQLEMIQFSSEPRRWRRRAVRAERVEVREAIDWIGSLAAEGGTEMVAAIAEALRPLRRDAQRQAVLISDGLVGFESEIVGMLARDLPAASRLHTVGVGPAPNRALTAAAARAGRGAEALVGLDEDPAPHVARLIARMRAPVLTDIKISGSALLDHAPAAVPDVFAGAPLRLALKLRPEGGDLAVRGLVYAGAWERRIDVPRVVAGDGRQAVVCLYGREAVEDLEVQHAAGVAGVDRDVERFGLDFQIATRLTSWVAVSEEPSVDPTQPVRRQRIPHAMPDGLSVEGLGLRQPTAMPFGRPVLSVASAQMRLAASPHVLMEPSGGAPYAAMPSRSQAPRVTPPSRWRFGADRFPPPPGPAPLRGRLIVRQERDVIVEIDVDAPLDWHPERASVVWSDGTSVEAEIAADRTTAAGYVVAGLTVRLALRMTAAGPAGPLDRVVLATPRGPLVVIVDRA